MPDRPLSAGAMLREVARLYTRAQRAVADSCQSTNSQCHLLTELSRGGPFTQSELGARLGLEKSWVSRAVDAMVDADLITKQVNPNDGRSWRLALTAKGRRRSTELNRSLDAHAEYVLQAISKRDRNTLEAILPALIGALHAQASPLDEHSTTVGNELDEHR